jgi:hypothetical protein
MERRVLNPQCAFLIISAVTLLVPSVLMSKEPVSQVMTNSSPP